MKVSDNYLDKVDNYLLKGLTLEHTRMTTEQKFRTRLVYEAYQIWVSDKGVNPSELLRNLAAREYALILRKAAEGDPISIEYRDALKIEPGVVRPMWAISNDVQTLNHIIAHFHQPTAAIDKAIVHDAGLWLYKHGRDVGDGRDVAKGAKILQELNHNFEDRSNIADNVPTAQIRITGDVGVVKTGRVNYTEEEIRKISKNVGVTFDEAVELIESEKGYYQEVVDDDEPEKDYIEKTQEEM